jgi:hypothetical protein
LKELIKRCRLIIFVPDAKAVAKGISFEINWIYLRREIKISLVLRFTTILKTAETQAGKGFKV